METNECFITVEPDQQVNVMFPSPQDFKIHRVARALANKCRFSGFTMPYYSVAQHCVLVSYLCDQKYALQGLFHELDEVFLPDIPTPLKKLMPPAWLRIARDHHTTGCMAFGIDPVIPDDVHKADRVAVCVEAGMYVCTELADRLTEEFGYRIEISSSLDFRPLSPLRASMAFIGRAKELGVPV